MAKKYGITVIQNGTSKVLSAVNYNGQVCHKVYARATANDPYVLVFDDTEGPSQDTITIRDSGTPNPITNDRYMFQTIGTLKGEKDIQSILSVDITVRVGNVTRTFNTTTTPTTWNVGVAPLETVRVTWDNQTASYVIQVVTTSNTTVNIQASFDVEYVSN